MNIMIRARPVLVMNISYERIAEHGDGLHHHKKTHAHEHANGRHVGGGPHEHQSCRYETKSCGRCGTRLR